MQILDFLSKETVTAELKAQKKLDVIHEMTELLCKKAKVQEKEKIVKALLEREAIGSTGIGQGVAIPHCKCDVVETIVAALGISKKGVDFDSLDKTPVKIIFLLVAPTNSAGNHLKALARISRLLADSDFKKKLTSAKSSEEVIRMIQQEDK